MKVLVKRLSKTQDDKYASSASPGLTRSSTAVVGKKQVKYSEFTNLHSSVPQSTSQVQSQPALSVRNGVGSASSKLNYVQVIEPNQQLDYAVDYELQVRQQLSDFSSQHQSKFTTSA